MANKLIRANGDIIINDDRSSSSSNDRWDIGDVRASLLTRTQFQARNGTDWELMDGTDVTGSALDTLVSLGSGLLPDATGKFLRMDDGGVDAQTLAATVSGTTQPDATSAAPLSVSGNAVSHSFPGNQNAPGSSGAEWTNNTGQTSDRILRGGAPGQTNTFHPTNASFAKSNFNHSHTLSASVNASDTETRPVNITVNYFVKIN